ncbi:potassium channel family protein [Cyclobacterium sp.]|uniref:potassium channel family protein n=1 Tax=Cyclobacterium sp. TaxID=1966343 RepID=UPI0019CDDB35|nr:potassium channel family protein [Cyclobacterium sp.]MBD3627750.1 two pore domain potassium channel family protein [Cyclobacterium sp.]
MNWILFITSVVLLLTVIHDFFFTVISINGAGPISSKFSALISTLFLKMKSALKTRKVLKYSGVSVILALTIWWIRGLWLGFYLLILSDDLSVFTASTRIAADAFDKIYYSGYVLSTMGNGDFVPGSSRWQIVIAVFSFSGFIFITTAMTYLISVSSAVIYKRSFGLYISDMMAFDKEQDKINCIYENANILRTMVNRHNQNHLAYPVVHYFFSIDREASFSVGLWNLNELLAAIQNKSEYHTYKVIPLIRAIDGYLETIGQSFIPKAQDYATRSEMSIKNFREQQIDNLLKSDGWDKFKKEYK